MALQDPNIMPSSRLDCPLSLKTPNMGNTGLGARNPLRQENRASPLTPYGHPERPRILGALLWHRSIA